MPNQVRSYVRKTREERREEIALAALDIMGEHGVEATTVARIAESVGMTHGALYRHFENRDAILAAAVALATNRSMAWFEGLESPDPLGRLRELVLKHAAFARAHMNVTTRSVFRLVAFVDKPEFEAQRDMEQWPAFQTLVGMAAEAKREGSIREDVAPEDVAWALLMFALNQNMALLMGAQRLADDVLVRNMERLLDSFTPSQGHISSAANTG